MKNLNFFNEVKKVTDAAEMTTENGAVMYQTSGSKLLDFYFKFTSYRDADESEIIKDFISAYAENPELALKLAFHVGDVREGLGERRTFRTIIKQVLSKYKHLIEYVPEYNRFDSLLCLLDTDCKNEVIDFIRVTLSMDNINMVKNSPITLLAKWLPSENASSHVTKRYAKIIREGLGMSSRTYRKTITSLRKYLDVIEVKMCSKEWDKINYETVPSLANLKYANAFIKNDGERRIKFLEQLTKGEVKVNSSVCYPHDIVSNYGHWGNLKDFDPLLEGMWKELPHECIKPLIVVRDGSGSMESKLGGTQVTALHVSTALAIYFAEQLPGNLRNKFITFSKEPKVIDLSKLTTLHDKLEATYSEGDCSNTNIEATFDLLLDTVVNSKMKQEEIPDVLVISDMEFDCAIDDPSANLFSHIADKWNQFGYNLPKLIFWNVCSRTKGIPIQSNKCGVNLVSGFSQNAIKLVMSGELDPYKALVSILMSTRYEPIK